MAVPGNSHRERVADRTRVHDDGRTRHHGRGKHGPPSRSEADAADLQLAIVELTTARQDLLAAYELEPVSKIGKLVQREAINSALAKIALATRFADAVVARRGGRTGDQDSTF